MGLFIGLVNSANRLRGMVPNGLTWDIPEVPRLKKYDYTSEFLRNNPLFRWFIPLGL